MVTFQSVDRCTHECYWFLSCKRHPDGRPRDHQSDNAVARDVSPSRRNTLKQKGKLQWPHRTCLNRGFLFMFFRSSKDKDGSVPDVEKATARNATERNASSKEHSSSEGQGDRGAPSGNQATAGTETKGSTGGCGSAKTRSCDWDRIGEEPSEDDAEKANSTASQGGGAVSGPVRNSAGVIVIEPRPSVSSSRQQSVESHLSADQHDELDFINEIITSDVGLAGTRARGASDGGGGGGAPEEPGGSTLVVQRVWSESTERPGLDRPSAEAESGTEAPAAARPPIPVDVHVHVPTHTAVSAHAQGGTTSDSSVPSTPLPLPGERRETGELTVDGLTVTRIKQEPLNDSTASKSAEAPSGGSRPTTDARSTNNQQQGKTTPPGDVAEKPDRKKPKNATRYVRWVETKPPLASVLGGTCERTMSPYGIHIGVHSLVLLFSLLCQSENLCA